MSGSKGPGPHLTSEDVNYMVYRYLQESGFQHTAFSFAHESNIHKTELDPNTVPPGALVTFVQRGMQYLEMEANLDIQENDITTEYQMLGPQDLMTKDIDELRQLVLDKKDERKEKQERQQKPKKERKQKQEQQDKQERQQERQERQQQEKQERQQKQEKQEAERADAMETDDKHVEITHVTTFAGHSSEVFICAWSPTEPLLASGSGDATARIWNVSMGDSQVPMVCDHNIDASQNNSRSKDVTTLDWSPDGELLATGCYDGWARVFSKTGELVRVLKKHTGPIFSLKWNKKGTCLLSGSVDRTAILWDAKSGEVKQQWQLHNAPTLDVDWKDNSTFATCSTDHMIYVCRLGTPDPVQVFKGHQDEVNAIKWDPSGNLLASCSDDCTIRLWSMNQDKPVHHLKLHSKEIYTIKWAPAGPGSANPDRPLVLASASFDSTVKIWDPETGQCKFNLRQHTEPVYSVGFSPDGRWLATGSFDKKMHIWSVDDGQLVKSYQGDGGIFEVAWNREGDKVAACFSNKTVCVVDLRFG